MLNSMRFIHNEVMTLGEDIELEAKESRNFSFCIQIPKVDESIIDRLTFKETHWFLEAQAEIPGVNLADTVGISVADNLVNDI